jgi:hypothetical protein
MATYNRGSGRPSLKDIVNQTLRTMIGTRCFISGQLAVGGTATKVKLAAAVDYCIDNVLYHKAITDNLFIHTDLTVQADDTTKYYLLTLDSGGNALITQGTSTDLPAAPAGECPVGYLKIVTDGGTFTPATTDHDDGNVTTTYVNLSQFPLALS